MMKLMVKGLRVDVTAEEVRAGMEKLGPVDSVQLVEHHGEDPRDAWAIVEMPISHERAFQISRQVTDLWHDGRRVNIQVLTR